MLKNLKWGDIISGFDLHRVSKDKKSDLHSLLAHDPRELNQSPETILRLLFLCRNVVIWCCHGGANSRRTKICLDTNGGRSNAFGFLKTKKP